MTTQYQVERRSIQGLVVDRARAATEEQARSLAAEMVRIGEPGEFVEVLTSGGAVLVGQYVPEVQG